MTARFAGADCRVCRDRTAHERISPASYGHDYWRCTRCGTVFHVRRETEERPS